MDKLYIIIPAYNEEDNINTVARDWHKVAVTTGIHSRLIIIDDGSKDNTYKKLKCLKNELKQLDTISLPNGGHGAAVLFGYHYALSHEADFIFQTDSDGQTLSSEFGRFWDNRNAYDLTIGYRSDRQDGLTRVIITKILRLFLLLFFHIWIKDANTPYRLMTRNSLAECIKIIPENFYLTNTVLTVIYKKLKFKTKYIPITFKPRQRGENKMDINRIFSIGKMSMLDFFKINKLINRQKTQYNR